MNLPPLLFKEDYNFVGANVGAVLGADKRDNWRIGVFDCFNAKDAGLNCCFAHCFCGSGNWTWKNAVGLVPHVEGEEMVLQQALQNQAMGAARDLNGNSGAFADVFIAGRQAAAAVTRADVRKQLFSVLYDDWIIQENPNGSNQRVRTVIEYSKYGTSQAADYFYVMCCGPCTMVQEVDAVQTWAFEQYGVTLKYGPVNPLTCTCCSLYTPDGRIVRQVAPSVAPTTLDMKR